MMQVIKFLLIITICGGQFTLLQGMEKYQLMASPAVFDNLRSWFDANDVDGDNIADDLREKALRSQRLLVWRDKSSLNNDAAQGEVTLAPRTQTDPQSKRTFVCFDRAGQFMNFTGDFKPDRECTLFLILKQDARSQGRGTLLSAPELRKNGPRISLPYIRPDREKGILEFPLADGVSLLVVTFGDHHITTYYNGRQIHFQPALSLTGTPGLTQIGSPRGDLNLQIAEIILFDKKLVDYDLEHVSCYLQYKYHLPTDFHEQHLNSTNKFKQFLKQSRRAGLIELECILDPANDQDGDIVQADNDHFGWPIAAMQGDDIVVFCQQSLSHYICDSPWDKMTNSVSSGVILVSHDRGVTWEKPRFIRDLVSGKLGPNAGGMNAIGVNPVTGTIALKYSYWPHGGLLTTSDGGRTWEHKNQAFLSLTGVKNRGNVGPRMIYHPLFGLLMIAGNSSEKMGAPLIFMRANENMERWDAALFPIDTANPKEPCGVVWDHNIMLIGRDFSPNCHADGRYQMLSSHLYRYQEGDRFEDIRFYTRRTNIRGNYDADNPERRVWSHDTADIDINPQTDRIEVLDSHRMGGGLGNTGNSVKNFPYSSLNIWSISKNDALQGGMWRFDGTLLKRFRTHKTRENQRSDGLHPGAAVMDAKRNMQHIFIYSGFNRSRTAIFKLSRTLDTQRLRDWLLRRYATIWKFQPDGTVKDTSSYELDAQAAGEPEYEKISSPYGILNCAVFEGEKSYFIFLDHENENFDFTALHPSHVEAMPNFTMEFIFQCSRDGVILSKKSLQNIGYQLAINKGKVVLSLDDGKKKSMICSQTNVADQKFHHVAVIRNSGHLLIYIDHQIDAFAYDQTGSLENDDHLFIGVDTGRKNFFHGLIGTVKITRRALSPNQFIQPEAQVQPTVQPGLVVDLGKNCFIDNQQIFCVNDLSGSGNTAFVPSGILPPVFSIEKGMQSSAGSWKFSGREGLYIPPNENLDGSNLTWTIRFKPDIVDKAEQTLLCADYDDRGDGQIGNDLWGVSIKHGKIVSHCSKENGEKVTLSAACPLNEWIELTTTWKNRELKQYLNGKFIGSATGVSAQGFFNQGVFIGNSSNRANGFSGKIAQVKIYNHALEPEITGKSL